MPVCRHIELAGTLTQMKRREFLVSAAGFALTRRGACFRPGPNLSGAATPSAKSVALPDADQVAWQDLEMGMFVHFAPNTWQDLESDNLSTPLSAINPEQLNTDQWAQTAVALGATYLVFVAKHQGGFCMWQTRTTEYSIRNTPWRNGKGDVLAEVRASCDRFGLKLGIYVCPRDDHFGAGTGGICATPELQARYDAMYRQQLTEVLSRYGPLVEVWFDGSTRTPVHDLLKRYQPHAMVFQGPSATIRWVGNEYGYAPYPCWNGISSREALTGTATSLNSDPDGSVWMPNEVDVSIRRPDWFWSTKNESKVLTLEQMLSIYYRSVGHGAQLLINIPADRHGLLPDKDCAVARLLGTEIRKRFGVAVASTSGSGHVLTMPFSAGSDVDTVVLQEDIRRGERVRSYVLEERSGDLWTKIGEGSAVGHKRIHPVPRRAYTAIRLCITASAGTPILRTFAAFDTGQPAPPDWDAPTEVWAANLVGQWKDHHFRLDLSTLIDAAAQYRLRFVALTGKVQHVSNVALLLNGSPNPALVKHDAAHQDQIVVDVTEAGARVTVSGTIEGAAEGSILLQKV